MNENKCTATNVADRAVTLEHTAMERRRWVRLTRLCNNHCLFCHDSDVQDGTFVPTKDVMDEISRNPDDAASERLVLSGGEPTMHPDFFDIIAHAKTVGYTRIQVITNGRAFAYKQFTAKATRLYRALGNEI